MLYRVSSIHLFLVSNCAWIFQAHNFKKALQNGGVAFPDCVSPKAIPRFADEIYILHLSLEPGDITRKDPQVVACRHMARARVSNKTGACVFLETEMDSNRVRMKCTMSKMHMISLWVGGGRGSKLNPRDTESGPRLGIKGIRNLKWAAG
jgi:hypothetical protein